MRRERYGQRNESRDSLDIFFPLKREVKHVLNRVQGTQKKTRGQQPLLLEFVEEEQDADNRGKQTYENRGRRKGLLHRLHKINTGNFNRHLKEGS